MWCAFVVMWGAFVIMWMCFCYYVMFLVLFYDMVCFCHVQAKKKQNTKIKIFCLNIGFFVPAFVTIYWREPGRKYMYAVFKKKLLVKITGMSEIWMWYKTTFLGASYEGSYTDRILSAKRCLEQIHQQCPTGV